MYSGLRSECRRVAKWLSAALCATSLLHTRWALGKGSMLLVLGRKEAPIFEFIQFQTYRFYRVHIYLYTEFFLVKIMGVHLYTHVLK